eukprot:347799-Chlamydomonas_euryale.AAC.1
MWKRRLAGVAASCRSNRPGSVRTKLNVLRDAMCEGPEMVIGSYSSSRSSGKHAHHGMRSTDD